MTTKPMILVKGATGAQGGRCNLAPALFGNVMQYNPGYYVWRYTPEQ